MPIIVEEITVTTTGSSGSATGTEYSNVVTGYLLDLAVNYHASAPATTDITITGGQGETLYSKSNSATDTAILPIRQQATDNTGAAISGAYVNMPVTGKITVTLAQCDALTGAAVVTVRILTAA